MSKGLEALERIVGCSTIESHTKKWQQDYYTVRKNLMALKIIVKKANIRLFEINGRYYFKTTNNLYEISKEKYDLLKEVL